MKRKIVSMLLSFALLRKVYSSKNNNDGWTIVMRTVDKGFTSIANYITNTDNNQKDKELFKAVKNGNLGVIESLAETNVIDFNQSTDNGQTPLHVAAAYGHLEIVKFLAKRNVDLEKTDSNGDTPVHEAVKNNHLDIVKFLSRLSVDLESINVDKQTPYKVASFIKEEIENRKLMIKVLENGELDVAEFLVKKGVDLHQTDKSGKTPVQRAAGKGHLEIVKLFAKQGVDFEQTDRWGQTIVHEAADRGHTEILKFLASQGVNLNPVNKGGWTPIHRAAINDHLETVKFLTSQGNVKLEEKSNDGQTPFDVAVTPEIKTIIQNEIERQNVIRHMITTVENGELDVLKATKEIDLNQLDKYGQNLIHVAARTNHLEITRFLVEQHVDLNRADNEGETPLHIAARFGCFEITKFLVEQLVDLNQTDKKGRTPFDVAKTPETKTIIQNEIEKRELEKQNIELKKKTDDTKKILSSEIRKTIQNEIGKQNLKKQNIENKKIDDSKNSSGAEKYLNTFPPTPPAPPYDHECIRHEASLNVVKPNIDLEEKTNGAETPETKPTIQDKNNKRNNRESNTVKFLTIKCILVVLALF